jgi:hypothetical protein
LTLHVKLVLQLGDDVNQLLESLTFLRLLHCQFNDAHLLTSFSEWVEQSYSEVSQSRSDSGSAALGNLRPPAMRSATCPPKQLRQHPPSVEGLSSTFFGRVQLANVLPAAVLAFATAADDEVFVVEKVA